MNMPLVSMNRRRRIGGAATPVFSPSALFALAEPGVWYDPSDLTTLFQDTAGTLPVTTPGQTVALALDKSKGLVLGPERVLNGTFTDGTTTYWTPQDATLSVVSQRLRITKTTAAAFGYATQQITGLSATTRYKVSANGYVGTGQVRLLVGDSPANGILYSGPQSATDISPSFFVTGAASLWVTILVYGGSGTFAEFDNISVKELPGFHATQATLASRPTYGIVPLGGRRNLLTRTEEFSNADWTNNPPITIGSGVTDPVGGSTAFTFTASSNNAEVYQTFTGRTVGQAHTTQIWMRRRTGTGDIQLYANAAQTTVTLTTSWQLITLTQNASATTIYSGVRIVTSGNAIDVWHPQFELGSSATAYQRVGSAFDVTEVGVASLSYLSFDGVDDWLVTPTITPGIDRAQVFAGVRKLSDAATGILVEHSTTAVNNGAFNISAPPSATATYACNSRGTINSAFTSPASYASPISNILTAQFDISGDTSALRVNGVSVGQSISDQGAGNFLAYPLYIGRRGGTTLPFNGQIYSMIVRFGTNLDAGTITSTETWVAGKTGVTL